MPRIPPIDPKNANPEVTKLYEHVAGWLKGQPGDRATQAETGLMVPQPWRVMAHSPKLAEVIYEASSHILSGLQWAKDHYRARQLIILTVVCRRQCKYAYVGHWGHCERSGISRAEFDLFATLEGMESAKKDPRFSKEEQMLMSFADDLARTGTVSKELFNQVQDLYGPQGAVEVTLITAFRIFSSAYINAFDLQDD
jgi:hypothetical protein